MHSQLTTNINEYLGWARVKRDALRIYAMGDSWFDYPGADVLTELYEQAPGNKRPVILKRSHAGNEAQQMLGGRLRHRMAADFIHMKTLNLEPDVILFSAGGNDLVGEYDFPMLIQPAPQGSDVAAFLNEEQLKLRLQQIVLDYIELGLMRDYYLPGVAIVTHQYDRVTPSDTGFEVLGIPLKRSWMKPYMDAKGITDAADQKKIADRLMRDFSALLASLKDGVFTINGSPTGMDDFYIAPTQGTLTHAEWANEIHPTPEGFARIAGVVLATIRGISSELRDKI